MTDEPTTNHEKLPASRSLAWIRAHHWAIQPDALQTIVDIAARDHEFDIEAIASKAGRNPQGMRTVEVRGSVAIVSINGPIFRYANLFSEISGATSLERVALEFSAMVADPNISKIILALDSPGGEVSGIHEFAQMVRDATAAKPVVAYVSNLAASAAYWIASAASSIVIDATAALGSVGVLARVSTQKDKNLVEVVSSQSPSKRVDVTTEEGRAQVQAHVDRLAQVFLESVAAFRGVDVESVKTGFGQGGLLIGSDAVRAGMADGLGSLEGTIAGISGTTKEQRMTTAAVAPDLSREIVADKHPAIAEEFRAEGRKAGFEEGAKAERERIQGVLAKTRTGHEALVRQLAFDGKTSPDQAAAQILDAMDAANTAKLAALKADAGAVIVPAAAAPTGGDPAPVAESPQVVALRAQQYQDEQAKLGRKVSAVEAVAFVSKKE